MFAVLSVQAQSFLDGEEKAKAKGKAGFGLESLESLHSFRFHYVEPFSFGPNVEHFWAGLSSCVEVAADPESPDVACDHLDGSNKERRAPQRNAKNKSVHKLCFLASPKTTCHFELSAGTAVETQFVANELCGCDEGGRACVLCSFLCKCS